MLEPSLMSLCTSYQVELADKLPHVQSLCIHEMIVRAFKHILQAVIAAVDDIEEMAGSVVSCLNVLLGSLPGEAADKDLANDALLKCKWLEVFLLKRFGWRWKEENSCDLRKFAILRGLCHKVLHVAMICCLKEKGFIFVCI